MDCSYYKSHVVSTDVKNAVCNCVYITVSVFLVFKFHLRYPKLFYLILQNSIVLVITRLQRLKGRSCRTFSIFLSTKSVYFFHIPGDRTSPINTKTCTEMTVTTTGKGVPKRFVETVTLHLHSSFYKSKVR